MFLSADGTQQQRCGPYLANREAVRTFLTLHENSEPSHQDRINERGEALLFLEPGNDEEKRGVSDLY
jgi:hypothetical protein